MRRGKRKRTACNNAQMHPRNRYFNNPPDFEALSRVDKQFASFVKHQPNGKCYIDWKDPRAVKDLTRVLLKEDFNLSKWDIPLDRLCPPVPNRLNYLHWIEDLLALGHHPDNEDDTKTIHGLDIGTGASAIYPLLGVRLQNWKFTATDIDNKSLEFAKSNIESNDLSNSITLVKTSPTDNLLLRKTNFDFCMCNPPFFDDMKDADTNPRNACSGSTVEMTTPGGDFEFINRIVTESLALKTNIKWYTSLVGRKRTLGKLLAVLKTAGIQNVHTTTFAQGRTSRWGIAWSFTSYGSPISFTIMTRHNLVSEIKNVLKDGLVTITKKNNCIVIRKNATDSTLEFLAEAVSVLNTTTINMVQGTRRDLFYQFADQLKSRLNVTNRRNRRAK